ncbi:tRNA uridine-5-carboxymethylaminomethyl(34) synthesis enzyme MnmG [candidate division LCP-89 bacterium B3_LCP]|uniref:tRNA uridine 5-carboxymethylaminomethyl modification enzyme MnmG n=1 Tax=candidate division LCP-89 bacterium B3_LCP TaxID=2012998 RepID=A0A532V4K0_UNCL8|nr:MAG: tRNA uridine-5-carboxymethylaminomethyl(34) synthesis enzyme MnmG [candidate division LCP-89 bacterium B3_LCP]
MYPEVDYDVVIVGGGHAGCEAASACARLGVDTLLITQREADLARMSCNPAIGGLAKGHLVKELDALGGIMGWVADRSSIQSRMLNRSKGPAVWSPRVQCDRELYTEGMRRLLGDTSGLDILEDEVADISLSNGAVNGVVTIQSGTINARKVVLCGGTFWNGVIYIGEWQKPAGRIGEDPAVGISDRLEKLGLRRIRLKTGTPPRLDGNTINFNMLERQDGEEEPIWFSSDPPVESLPQRPCFLTYTNEETHDILQGGLDRSPLYTGRIKGVGPRYCPSIEDKIVRFADKNRHQLFIEPEGLQEEEYYINGFATSLPEDVQLKALRTVPGLSDVKMNRPGYAVEYDVFPAEQLSLSLECRIINNLYLAGQINGTSGYEEAAVQGFIAGINAARSILGNDQIVLGRDQAYIGVLIEDLITKIPEEPYRMFTSRAEFRLLLRQDNARQRLLDVAQKIGLVSTRKQQSTKESIDNKDRIIKGLKSTSVLYNGVRMKSAELLKRPEIKLTDLVNFTDFPGEQREFIKIHSQSAFHAEVEIKYNGYLVRQQAQVESFRKMEQLLLPVVMDYESISALSAEARCELNRIRPETLGQASRIPGVRAADVSVLMVLLKKGW